MPPARNTVEIYSIRPWKLVSFMEAHRTGSSPGGQARILGRGSPRSLHVGRKSRRRLHAGNLDGSNIPSRKDQQNQTRNPSNPDSLPSTRHTSQECLDTGPTILRTHSIGSRGRLVPDRV